MRRAHWHLAGFYFCYFAFVGAFSPYWSLYLQHLGFAAVDIALLMSSLQFTRILAPWAWGWLADHLGRRALIVRLAAFISLICYLGVFFGQSFAWLMAVMLLMSFFWSASLPLVEATTLAHLGRASQGYSRIRLWGSIGFLLTVIAVGHALDLLPVAELLWIVLTCKLAIVVFAIRLPETGLPKGRQQALPMRDILRRPEVTAFFLASLTMGIAHGPYYTFFSIYLVDLGYSKGAVGWLWALGVLAEIGVFMLMPRLVARQGLRRLLLISFALAILRFVITGWLAQYLTLILLAQLLHAATFAVYHAAAVQCVHRFFDGPHHAKGQAVYSMVSYGIGGTIGGLMSGYFWPAGAGITFSLGAAAALIGFGLVLLWVRLPQE